MGKDPRDAAMDLVIADRGETSVIISIMREDDVRLALSNPMISIGTDSGARAEDGPLSESKSHPRAWGSFTRILGKYVRDEKLIPLEDAIRRFTSRPATRVGHHRPRHPAARHEGRRHDLQSRRPFATCRPSSIRRTTRRASSTCWSTARPWCRAARSPRAAGATHSRTGVHEIDTLCNATETRCLICACGEPSPSLSLQ